MKKNGILCILIAAALLVTSLAAVSADQTTWITQEALQVNNNAISGTMPNIAINSSNNQQINSVNIQAQSAVAVQTGNIVAAGGDIRDSNITSGCECGVGNQTALIGQVAIQLNNNSIGASPADRGTIAIDVIGNEDNLAALEMGGGFGISSENENDENDENDGGSYSEDRLGGGGRFMAQGEEIHIAVSVPNVAVRSPNNQQINSMNIQEQCAVAVQTGEIVGAVGDIRDCNIGPIARVDGDNTDGDNTNGDGDGPPPKAAPAAPAARP